MAQTNIKEQIVNTPDALDNEVYKKNRFDFLNKIGWNNVSLEALPAHASYRRYYRVIGGKKPALLMDATLDVTEPLQWFVTIDKHLQDLGLSVPEIYDYEITDDCSLALIEDFGDNSYDALIDNGEDAMPLYEKAIDVLAYLHSNENAIKVDAPKYTLDKMLSEATNILDWYVPAVRGNAVNDEKRLEYREIWKNIFKSMPPMKDSLVLFDYAFNNMMDIDGHEGIESCGVLDFQMARIGPAIYDVVSLLEDIRRDLSQNKFAELKTRYLEKSKVTDTEEEFDLWFSVMTMQRHCKNFGNLIRLFVRDGKPELLQYIPRMQAFSSVHLQLPIFKELKEWFEENDIDMTANLKEGFEYANGYPER